MNATELIGVGQLFVAVIGFYIVYRQLTSINASLQSDAQSKLYAQSGDVRKLLAEYPELRKYFFDGVAIEKKHDNYSRTRTLAELYANYLEHFLIQVPNLREKDWDTWSGTLRDIYQSSPIIRELISEKKQWYSEELHAFVNQCIDE